MSSEYNDEVVNNPTKILEITSNKNENVLQKNLPISSANNNNTHSIEDTETENALGNSNDRNNNIDDSKEKFTKIIKASKGGAVYENVYCSYFGKI